MNAKVEKRTIMLSKESSENEILAQNGKNPKALPSIRKKLLFLYCQNIVKGKRVSRALTWVFLYPIVKVGYTWLCSFANTMRATRATAVMALADPLNEVF